MGKHEPYFPVGVTHDQINAITDTLRRHTDEFDTIVVTGISGQFIGPIVAYILDKHYAVVRKPNDGSHDMSRLVGTVGKRWIFFDDFIASGATLSRVQQVMSEDEPKSQFAGTFEYTREL